MRDCIGFLAATVGLTVLMTGLAPTPTPENLRLIAAA
jgi:hypothetical protein